MNYSNISFYIILIIGVTYFGLLGNATKAPPEYKLVAQRWADCHKGGTVDEGIPYYIADDIVAAWVFTVYRDNKIISANKIHNIIEEKRRELKKEYEFYILANKTKNQDVIAKANKDLIKKKNAIRGINDYATIFVGAGKNNPIVFLYYEGLPEHIVKFKSAKIRAQQKLNTKNVDFKKCYFFGYNRIYLEFLADRHKAFVNVDGHQKPVVNKLHIDKSSSSLLKMVKKRSMNTQSNSQKPKSTVVKSKILSINEHYSRYWTETLSRNWDWYESNYPDSLAPFYRGCVNASISMILGYWHDRGYRKFLNPSVCSSSYIGISPGDDSAIPDDYSKHWDEWSEGWGGLIANTIYDVLGNSWGEGSNIYAAKSGMLNLCNDPGYNNNYNFYCSDIKHGHDYNNYYWDEFKNEIDKGRPFYVRKGWRNINQLHAMTAIGYEIHNILPGGDSMPENRYRIFYDNFRDRTETWYDGWLMARQDGVLLDMFFVKPGTNQGVSGLKGNISGDVSWRSNVFIEDDITIENGVTVKIEPGIKISLASNASIIVNGTLCAKGTCFEPIVFTSSGIWDGIKLIDTDKSTFNYCEIKNASNGIYLNNSCSNINHCIIHNNCYDGIYMMGGSNLVIRNTIIKNNGYDGIFCSYYSELNLGDCSQYGSQGYNQITNNKTGINATSNSYVLAGIFYDQRVLNCYNNSIYNNIYHDVGAINADIVVQCAWWGKSNPDPSQFSTNEGGTIKHSQELPSNPDIDFGLLKNMCGKLSTSSFRPNSLDRDNPESLWELAQYYRFTREIDKAINLNREIIERFSSSIYASKSMCQLFHISEENKLDGIKNYFNFMRKKQLPEELEETVIDLSIIKYIRDKEYNQAIQLCEHVLQKQPNTSSDILALNNLVLVNNQMANVKKASKYFAILKKKYSDTRLTLMAREIMGEKVDWSEAKDYQPEDPKMTGIILPLKYTFHQNYPNPFNSSTTIVFKLPKALNVKLLVYDINGKLIEELINEYRSSGIHKIIWKPANISSGIYFYRIKAGDFSAVKKCIFMK